jgi:hypothetical protein
LDPSTALTILSISSNLLHITFTANHDALRILNTNSWLGVLERIPRDPPTRCEN